MDSNVFSFPQQEKPDACLFLCAGARAQGSSYMAPAASAAYTAPGFAGAPLQSGSVALGAVGAAGATGAPTGAALGTASSPIHMVPLEGGWRSQLWRTVRSLALAFVVLSGVGAIMEDRGLGKGDPSHAHSLYVCVLAAVACCGDWKSLPAGDCAESLSGRNAGRITRGLWKLCRQAARKANYKAIS